MKIAVIGTRGFPRIQGGVENHCEHLYPHLVKLGCDVTVYTRKPYVKYPGSEYKGIHLRPLSCPRSKFLEAVAHTFRGILEARKIKPDILHIHGIGPSLFAPLGRLLGMNVVVSNHGPDYMREKWPLPAKLFLKFCERMGVTFANEVIAISQNISEDISDKFHRKATVLPNGIETTKERETEDALLQFGLQKKKYILAVGRLVPEKGFHDLIDAFDTSNVKDFKLVIAGDADHEDNYSRDLKKRAVKMPNVILTGFLTKQPLQELYSHAALFVLPSYHEGLPIVLLEAMSYGLSCIASDIPANRHVELSEDRFFKTGDKESMSKRISEYIYKKWDDEAKSSQLRIINERYNWKTIAEGTLRVYGKIIS